MTPYYTDTTTWRQRQRGTGPRPDHRQAHNIRFTAEEWATIESRAADCGTPSARETALGTTPRIRRSQGNAELIRQLGYIGNNLNQLAFLANDLQILHDLNLAAQFADQIVLMRNGRTIVAGTPDEY